MRSPRIHLFISYYCVSAKHSEIFDAKNWPILKCFIVPVYVVDIRAVDRGHGWAIGLLIEVECNKKLVKVRCGSYELSFNSNHTQLKKKRLTNSL